MGRGLSEQQLRIMRYAIEEGSVNRYDARNILFQMLPARKQRMRATKSRTPGYYTGQILDRNGTGVAEWIKTGSRVFTPSERRDNSVAASASRAITRLVRRGLLTPGGRGWVPTKRRKAIG